MQHESTNKPDVASTTRETSATGAVRETLYHKGPGGFPLRYDLVFSNEVGLRRIAETFGEGFLKYGAHNWKQGFPESVLLNHAFEHLRKWMAGDRTEDHLSHAMWNIYTLMWVEEQMPELLDVTGIPLLATLQKPNV